MIPKKFLKSGEGAVASYNWTDIAEGTGLVQFYGGASGLEGDRIYIMHQDPFYTTEKNGGSSKSEATTSLLVDKTFSLEPFNSPRVLIGTAWVTFARTIGWQNNSGVVWEFWDVIDIINVTTDEVLTTFTSEKFVTTGTGTGAQSKTEMRIHRFSISTSSLKKGEALGVRIRVYGKINTGTWNKNAYISYDPLNRDDGSFTPSTNEDIESVLRIKIPFKIDL